MHTHNLKLIFLLTCDILNQNEEVLIWGKEKDLLNNLYEKLKKWGFFKTNVTNKECLFHGQTNNERTN